MAESIMTFVLGFLLAGLIAVSSAVPFWRRAVQITKKRLLAVSPLSSAEVGADRDRLRAQFAMSTRKLERSIESLRAKAHAQVLQIARRGKDIKGLKEELSRKSKTAGEQGAEIERLGKSLAQTQAELTGRVAEIADLKEKIAQIETMVARQTGVVKAATVQVETGNKEIAALNKTVKETGAALEKTRNELAGRDEKLSRALRAAAEHKERAGELAKELAGLKNSFTRTESQRDALSEKSAKRETESKLRISALTGAGTKVEKELRHARGEIAKLTARLQAATEQTEQTEQRDALSKRARKDAAMLRKQIDDLTSHADRATSEIERVGVDAGLAETPAPAPSPPKKDLPTSLAERIRSLQEHHNLRA